MSTAITTPPAKTRISTLEALRQLDSFIRSSEIARDYEQSGRVKGKPKGKPNGQAVVENVAAQ